MSRLFCRFPLWARFLTVGSIIATGQAQDLSSEDAQALAEHAASCSAYFYSAAHANGVSQYETFYGAGEYSFNLAVSTTNEAQALESFNRASKRINQLMQKRWSEFHKVEEQFGKKCAKLVSASQAEGKQ
ncbi:MAG: hypothetical protein ACU84Q_11860 [Gammaproteobacteria bacterium]